MGKRGPVPVNLDQLRSYEILFGVCLARLGWAGPEQILKTDIDGAAIRAEQRQAVLDGLWAAIDRRTLRVALRRWRKLDARSDAAHVRDYIDRYHVAALSIIGGPRWPKLGYSRARVFAGGMAGAVLGLSPQTGIRLLGYSKDRRGSAAWRKEKARRELARDQATRAGCVGTSESNSPGIDI